MPRSTSGRGRCLSMSILSQRSSTRNESERDGVRPGQLGDAACFSFYATKNITCGEGGAVATPSPEIAARIRLLRQHGMSTSASDRYAETYRHWDMETLGWKYNMTNL